MYPWKAKECSGCGARFRNDEKKKWCDDCKKLIESLPESISTKFRRGEITKDGAKELLKRMQAAEEANSAMISRKCKIGVPKRKIGVGEFMKSATKLGVFTCPQLANEMEITVQTAYTYLNKLLESGDLTKEQCGKYVFWSVTGSIQERRDPTGKNGSNFNQEYPNFDR
jgi:hypothetical protein